MPKVTEQVEGASHFPKLSSQTDWSLCQADFCPRALCLTHLALDDVSFPQKTHQELQTTSHFLLTASRGWCRSQFTHLPGAAGLLLPCTFSRCVSTFISSEHLYLCKVYYTVCMSIGPLTGIWSRYFGLQFLDLFNQQRDVLQQVFVLEEQLVDSSLGLQPSRGLRTQLVLQEMDLQQKMWGVKSLLTSREKWILCNERGKPNPAHTNIFFPGCSSYLNSPNKTMHRIPVCVKTKAKLCWPYQHNFLVWEISDARCSPQIFL